MKNIKFYSCPVCNHVTTSTGNVEVSCCGKKLEALVPQAEAGKHALAVENNGTECYITFEHGMSKEHFISYIAYVEFDRMECIQLYPEQSGEASFKSTRRGKIYFVCNTHGLYVKEV